MKRIPFFIVLMCACILIVGSGKKNEPPKKKFEPVARWTGTLSFEEKTVWKEGCISATSERHAKVNFTAALPTMYRDVETTDFSTFTDNKGTGTADYHSEGNMCGNSGTTDCTGTGVAELHAVTIREWDNTYDIEAIAPPCNGSNSDGTPYGPDVMEISVSNEPLLDKDHLAGTKTVTSEVPGTTATVTRTTTWHLERVKEDDVELIVTPGNYDNWLPEPGRNEMFKGSVMTINLKLQGKNGKPLKAKAESFELRLNNTSIEPGITINYPLKPDANQLPDLRFIMLPNIESEEEDQSISVGSPDGVTGKAFIASYDGGGWTTLTVEAILKDTRHIQGKLLVSNGETDIRIPKRDPNSHIAEVWLKANGNPGEMDDKETSKGNNYNGDGLTAYEEYRGVISQGKFKRLDPKVKEVGVDVIKPELSFFGEGIKWFENATKLKAIIFHEDLGEIGLDRRVNKNTSSSHSYDQYALRLYKSVIPKPGVMGKAYGGPGTPAKTYAVVIDNNSILDDWQNWQNYARTLSVPITFTLQEFVANVVAHEMGHGVSCWHHGESGSGPQNVNALDTLTPFPNKIFDMFGREITTRPYLISGFNGVAGNQESGDIFCIMTYNPYCKWAYSVRGTVGYFFQVPIIPPGNKICNSGAGTSINRSDPAGNSNYFGNANVGNCLAQINLKD